MVSVLEMCVFILILIKQKLSTCEEDTLLGPGDIIYLCPLGGKQDLNGKTEVARADKNY